MAILASKTNPKMKKTYISDSDCYAMNLEIISKLLCLALYCCIELVEEFNIRFKVREKVGT